MKTFKIADCFLQVILIAISVVLLFSGQHSWEDILIGCYFVVGGWQMVSIAVHAFSRPEYGGDLRKKYFRMLLATGIALAFIVLASLVSNPGAMILGLLLLMGLSPVLAVVYLVACFQETTCLIRKDNQEN